MKRSFQSFISVICVSIMVMSVSIVSLAAADPEQNIQISYFTESANWDVTPSGVASGTRTMIDFSSVDAGDAEHGEVVHYYYQAGATMGGAVRYNSAMDNSTPNKMLSLDFYLYDNTIPYEIRLMGYDKANPNQNTSTIGEFDINYEGPATKITEPNAQAVIGIKKNSVGSDLKHDGNAVSVTNQQWHKLDVIFTKTEVKYYIDGVYLDTSAVKSDFLNLASNTFSGVQVVSRKDIQSDAVEPLSGLYVDNVKVQVYESNAQFYGIATPLDSEISIAFSESISAQTQCGLNSIQVYDTSTGEEISIGTPEQQDLTTIIIPLNETLALSKEYVVKMPADLTGISGKTLYSNIYFNTKAGGIKTYQDEDFTSYDTITGTTGDILILDNRWAPYINVKDSGEPEHGKVVYVTNTELAAVTDLRWGIKCSGEGMIDVSKGEASVEFDMKIPNTAYSQLYIQPYSHIEGLSDVEQVRTNIASNEDKGGRASQFCTLSVSSGAQMATASGNNPFGETYEAGKAWIQMRSTSNAPVIAQPWAGLNGNYCYKTMDPGTWHTVKITIDKSSGSAVVKLYLDGTFVGQNQANTLGEQATDYLRGIRFSIKPPAGSTTPVADFLQIDNVKFTGPAVSEHATKIRMYNIDGEEFGSINGNGLKASADRAEIFYEGNVDTYNAVVTLTDGVDVIDSNLYFDETENKLVAYFNGVMKKNTQYTLKVTGVTTVSGDEVVDASALFTTNDVGEFIIDGLEITDAEGNELALSTISTNQTVYARVNIINTTDEEKTAMVVAAAYNDTALSNASYVEYQLDPMTKQTVTDQVALSVGDISNLAVKGFVWEGFSSNKPLVDEYVCSQ